MVARNLGSLGPSSSVTLSVACASVCGRIAEAGGTRDGLLSSPPQHHRQNTKGQFKIAMKIATLHGETKSTARKTSRSIETGQYC